MSRWSNVDWIREHTDWYLRDPVAAHDWNASPAGVDRIVPTLLLTTTGRTTGEKRALPLLYQPCGAGWILVGSRGGSRAHPNWYLNLLANPDCHVQVGRFAHAARARTLEGEERAPYWDLMARFWPDYVNYQARTTRELPVVMLEAAD